MPLTPRTLLPLFLTVALALSGCQTLSPDTQRDTSERSTLAGPESGVVLPVTIHLAQSEPAPELLTIQVPEGIIYLQMRPLLTRKDLTDAAALSDRQGGHFVGLRFTQQGAQRLSAASHALSGVMLAVVIGRELVAAPRIESPLDDGILAFEVPSAQAAAKLASQIRGDIPP